MTYFHSLCASAVDNVVEVSLRDRASKFWAFLQQIFQSRVWLWIFGTSVHWRILLNQLEKKLAHLQVICSCFDPKHLGIWCFPWRCGDVIRWKFQLSLMLQRKAWKLNSNVLEESEQRGQIKRIQQLFIWRFTHLCDDVGKLSGDFWTSRSCQCYHLLEYSWPSSSRCVATVIEEYVEQELFILVFLRIIWIKKSLEKNGKLCMEKRWIALYTLFIMKYSSVSNWVLIGTGFRQKADASFQGWAE